MGVIGTKFGYWEVIGYSNSRHKLKCRCICGNEREVNEYDLKYGTSTSCGCSRHKAIQEMIGKRYGEWEALRYAGKLKVECRCSCGKVAKVYKQSLLKGESKSCGHTRTKIDDTLDIIGKKVGDWIVLRKCGNHKWVCQCSCGNIREVSGYALRDGLSKSCGHDFEFIDLTDNTYGRLIVNKYLGEGYWECDCSCGTKGLVRRGKELRNGSTKSCGCLSKLVIQMTMSPNRTEEQMEAVRSRQSLVEFIGDTVPTICELADELGISYSHAVRLCNKFEVTGLVAKFKFGAMQEEFTDLIRDIMPDELILTNNRTILGGKELDIYIPSLKLAIEFNGTYWHSDIFKHSNYHSEKTIACAKKGIRLIHIFEYEWQDEELRQKTLNYLYNILASKIELEGATEVSSITYTEAAKICEEFHFQGAIERKEGAIYTGCYINNALVAAMILRKYGIDNEYELVRLCFKPNIETEKITEKMWNYVITNYKIGSVIVNCDISKFTGNSYLQLGFKVCTDLSITEPDYVWVKPTTNHIINSYQVTKEVLGVNNHEYTEDEIMENLGYVKIYDSGSLRLKYE